jgi:hypothetical protein
MQNTPTRKTGIKAIRHMTNKEREKCLQYGEVISKMMEGDDRKFMQREGWIPSDPPPLGPTGSRATRRKQKT